METSMPIFAIPRAQKIDLNAEKSLIEPTKYLVKYKQTGNLLEVTRILFELTRLLVNSNNCKWWLRNLCNLNRILIIATRITSSCSHILPDI